MNTDEEYHLHDPKADYEKAETDLLKEALERNPSERFDKLMQLVKLGFMLKNAKITHKAIVEKVK